MADTSYRQSPLAHLGLASRVRETLGEAGLGICERDYRVLLNLRVDLSKEPGAQGTFETSMGIRLPETPNTATGKDRVEALWLGPNEWQIVIHDNRPDVGGEWAARLREAMSGHFCAVVDVSCAQAVIGATGPMVREVLERAVPLDMHPSKFRPGEVKQTLFGRHCGVTLHLRDDAPNFDIYTRRSFADYVWRYLEDCARGAETQVAVTAG